MQKEKKSLLKPLPIFCAVVCIGIVIAYSFLIYTNNKQQQILISFLESSFSSTASIEDFEYSPISKILHIKNLSIYYPNSEDKALTMQDIRTNIPNIEKEPLEIKNMTINGINLYTKQHNGKDLIFLLSTPSINLKTTKELQHYKMLIRSINMDTAIIFAPAIDTTQTKPVQFNMPIISVGNLDTGDYTVILSTIFGTMAKNVSRVLLKHNISYKLRAGSAKLGLIQKLAISSAKKQLEKLDKEMDTIGKTISDNINSLQNKN